MAAAADTLNNCILYVKETEKKGKGLFTPVPIKEGDIIFEEKPTVSCQFSWNRQYGYTSCDYCMKSIETAQNMARRLTTNYDFELPYTDKCCEMSKLRKDIVKCSRCKVVYCCEICRIEAENKYHRVLCLGQDQHNSEHPMNKLEEIWKKLHYPPETATIMLIVRMVAMIIQSEEKESLISLFDQFVSRVKDDEYKITHKLLGEEFQNQLSTLYQYLKEALPIEQYPKLQTIDGFKSLFALIGTNGQGIGTSSLSQYVHNVDSLSLSEKDRQEVDAFIDQLYEDIEEESGQFLNCEGSGLFQLQSRCNHSCSPNAEITFPYNNSKMLVVALTDISADEEISICYLDECQRGRSRHSRQKILRDNYLFNCSCSLCEAESDQANVTSSEEESDEEMT